MRIAKIADVSRRPEDRLSGDQHGPGGHANRAGPGPLVERMGEGHALVHEPVHVGRPDFLIVQSMNAFTRLIVGENEQEIRLQSAIEVRRLRAPSRRPKAEAF